MTVSPQLNSLGLVLPRRRLIPAQALGHSHCVCCAISNTNPTASPRSLTHSLPSCLVPALLISRIIFLGSILPIFCPPLCSPALVPTLDSFIPHGAGKTCAYFSRSLCTKKTSFLQLLWNKTTQVSFSVCVSKQVMDKEHLINVFPPATKLLLWPFSYWLCSSFSHLFPIYFSPPFTWSWQLSFWKHPSTAVLLTKQQPEKLYENWLLSL